MSNSTAVPGLFTVGDSPSGNVKRMASAIDEGSIAIHLVHRFLAKRERLTMVRRLGQVCATQCEDAKLAAYQASRSPIEAACSAQPHHFRSSYDLGPNATNTS